MRRLWLGLAALLLAACGGGPAWPDPGHGPSSITLSAQQRRIADEIVDVFEHGDANPHYDAVEALGDGRGLTCGTIGFTTSSGEVRTVVEDYAAAVPGARLARHLPRLRELGAQGSADTAGLPGFAEDWAAAAADPRFRAAQDALAEKLAFAPALEDARRLGLRTPLGVAVLYDAAVQHGTGDDPDGLPALIDRATRKAGGTAATGVEEPDWLGAFLDARSATLRAPHDPATRAAWAESVDRVDALRTLVDDDRQHLDPPLKLTVYGDDHELR